MHHLAVTIYLHVAPSTSRHTRHELSVIIGQSQIHDSWNGKITTGELYLWRQNSHYFSVFPIESPQLHNTWCYFYWLGQKMTGCFCFEVAISPLAMTRLE